jgi:hypothetical protein
VNSFCAHSRALKSVIELIFLAINYLSCLLIAAAEDVGRMIIGTASPERHGPAESLLSPVPRGAARSGTHRTMTTQSSILTTLSNILHLALNRGPQPGHGVLTAIQGADPSACPGCELGRHLAYSWTFPQLRGCKDILLPMFAMHL